MVKYHLRSVMGLTMATCIRQASCCWRHHSGANPVSSLRTMGSQSTVLENDGCPGSAGTTAMNWGFWPR